MDAGRGVWCQISDVDAARHVAPGVAPAPVRALLYPYESPPGRVPERDPTSLPPNARRPQKAHVHPPDERPEQLIPPDTTRILIVRLTARGDLVFASPLAGALRRRFPTAYIAWAAEEHTAEVIQGNPHLDEVIVWDRRAPAGASRHERMWGGNTRDFMAELRSRRFEVVIDTQGLLRSAFITLLSGADVRIGLGSREGSGLLMSSVIPRGGNPRLFASEYLFLAGKLGLDTSTFNPEIPCLQPDLTRAMHIVGRAKRAPGFVAACPFSSRSFKQWPLERWAELIRRLRSESQRGVVLLGGPEDRDAANQIERDIDAREPSGSPSPPLMNLAGRTTLGEASAVVSLADLAVGVDTGLSHMAVAHGRPTVLIFGSNTPYLDPPAPSVAILHSGRSCSPCRGRLTCDGRIDCMNDISVAQVLAAASSVELSGSSPSPAPPGP